MFPQAELTISMSCNHIINHKKPVFCRKLVFKNKGIKRMKVSNIQKGLLVRTMICAVSLAAACFF